MLQKAKQKAKLAAPPRELIIQSSVLITVIAMMSFVGVADEEAQENLQNSLENIADFISLIVLGVAVPNGAYGFLQYMTAGSNVEQDEKGRTRIRNTFIGIAGVAVIQTAVTVFDSFVEIE